MMGGNATLVTHQPWQRNWSSLFYRGYDSSDVATLQRRGGSKPRLVCYVMEDEDSRLISHLKVEEGVNWRPVGSRILDTFFWLNSNTGQVQLLETDGDEGFCRCIIRKGTRCGPDCELVKMGAECAGSAHLEQDCGNKEISKLKRRDEWPAVHLDIFPGMGLGLRATARIATGTFVGPYYGRAKTMPKRLSRKGHHYLVDMEGGVVIDAAREGTLMRYVNSSCDPNVRLSERVIEGRAELFYLSSKPIEPGDDITTSYGDSAWCGVCLCRKPGCVGSISGRSHE